MAAVGDPPLTVDITPDNAANSVPEPTRPGRSALDYLIRSCDLATRSLAWRLLGTDDLDDLLLDVYDTAHRRLGRAADSEIARNLHRSPVWNGTRDAAEELRRIMIGTCVARTLSSGSATAGDGGEPVPPPLQAPKADRVRWVWRSLPGEQRLVLALALTERHTTTEIAALLGTTAASAEGLLGEARSSLLGAVARAGLGGEAGDGGEPLVGGVIRQVQQLDPPRHRDHFWDRVDRRLDRLEGRPDDPQPPVEQPEEPTGHRRALLAPLAVLIIVGAAVAGGWYALPDSSSDEVAAPIPIDAATDTTTSRSTTSVTRPPTSTIQVTTTTVEAVDPVAAPPPTPVAAPVDEGTASEPTPEDEPTPESEAATDTTVGCVEVPTGWGAWEAAYTGPNEGDDLYIEIFVVDDGDPCTVTVEVTVDVWYQDDHVISPYVELAGNRQVIHEGELGYEFGNLPFTTVLQFDKPQVASSWVLGYSGYYYSGDPGGFFSNDAEPVTMGPEQAPPLAILD